MQISWVQTASDPEPREAYGMRAACRRFFANTRSPFVDPVESCANAIAPKSASSRAFWRAAGGRPITFTD